MAHSQHDLNNGGLLPHQPRQDTCSQQRHREDERDAYAYRLSQDLLLTEAMGGLLAEQSEEDLDMIYDVLDVGCGLGRWVLSVAQTFFEMEVTGVDPSAALISSTQTQARQEGLSNAHFLVMDVTKPLAFANDSFDFVNARSLSKFLSPDQWVLFLLDCQRLLRPGGLTRITEGAWSIDSTELPAIARLCTAGLKEDSTEQKHPFDRRSLARFPLLVRLFRQIGFRDVQCKASVIDASAGSKMHRCLLTECKQFFRTCPSLVFPHGETDQEAEEFYTQALKELESPHFTALFSLLTVWGRKEKTAHPNAGSIP